MKENYTVALYSYKKYFKGLAVFLFSYYHIFSYFEYVSFKEMYSTLSNV